jgi:archaellum component FlaC
MGTADAKEPITRETLDEAVDVILEAVTRLLVGLAGEMTKRFDKGEARLHKIETELSSVKDGMKASKSKLSTTPSRREFNELKTRVDRSHPL